MATPTPQLPPWAERATFQLRGAEALFSQLIRALFPLAVACLLTWAVVGLLSGFLSICPWLSVAVVDWLRRRLRQPP